MNKSYQIKMNKEKVYFVIPAYNEEENLDFLITNIDKFMHFFGYDYHIFLVNDGSTDNTAIVAQNYKNDGIPLTLLNHKENYGPGRAFKTGFGAALNVASDSDIIVTIEADNTSDLCVLNRMLEQCKRGNDLVLASVYGEGAIVGAPLHRKIFSHCCNIILQIIFRIKGVNTFTSFFRVYRASMLKEAMDIYKDKLIEEGGFICMLELLVKLHKLGYQITQVPMLLDFRIRMGNSKMKSVRNIKDTLRFIWKYLTNHEEIVIEPSDKTPKRVENTL